MYSFAGNVPLVLVDTDGRYAFKHLDWFPDFLEIPLPIIPFPEIPIPTIPLPELPIPEIPWLPIDPPGSDGPSVPGPAPAEPTPYYATIDDQTARDLCCDETGSPEYQIVKRECYRWYDDQGEPWPTVTLRQTCIRCTDAGHGEGVLHHCVEGSRIEGYREPLDFTWDEWVDELLGSNPEMAFLGYYEAENMLCTPESVE